MLFCLLPLAPGRNLTLPPPLADCTPPPLPQSLFVLEGLEGSLEGGGGLEGGEGAPPTLDPQTQSV